MGEHDTSVILGILGVAIAALLLNSVVTAGITSGGSDATESRSGDDTISVTIDCNVSEVRVTAPAEAEYSLRVGQTIVGPTSSKTGSTTTDASGDTTVSVEPSDVMFAFVFQDGETVTSAVKICDDETGAKTTGGPADEGAPSITIDCDANRLRVDAHADQEYTLKVSQLRVTPTGTDSSSEQQTVRGSTTVSFADESAVFAFITTDAGTVATAHENCMQSDRSSE